MKTRWNAASAWFSAMNRRERGLMAAAALVAAVMGGDALWAAPQWMRASLLEKQLAQQADELSTLEGQIAGMKAGMRDPDASNRATQDGLNRQLAGSDAQLREFGDVLVPPEKMPELLRSLLARHRGLELLSLQTLPPAPLIERPARKPEAGKESGPPREEDNLYKHGIEIKVAGSYADLLTYLSELEKSPQRFLWGQMTLSVTKHPRSELKMTLHTLSLEKTWLTV